MILPNDCGQGNLTNSFLALGVFLHGSIWLCYLSERSFASFLFKIEDMHLLYSKQPFVQHRRSKLSGSIVVIINSRCFFQSHTSFSPNRNVPLSAEC